MTIEQHHPQIYSVEDGIQAEATRKRYKVSFNGFLQYCQYEQSALLKESPRLLEEGIIGYIRFLHSVKGQGRNTINISVSAIFHFFEMNDIILNRRKVKRFIPPDEKEKDGDRSYTYEEIQQILLNCDERSRVMILLMASTGMRIGAISAIKLGHLTEIPEYHVYKIVVYANSPKARYYTFCTPECAAAIDSYLDYRRRFGDPLIDKAPLIREQFDINDRFHAAHPKPIKDTTIEWILEDILSRSGLKSKEVMRSHGFRKFAITQMIRAKCDYEAREYLVGHRHSRGLDVNYDRTSEEDRLTEYLKAVDLLTINPENRLRRQVEQLTIRSDKLEELSAQMDRLNKKLGLD